MKEQELWSHLKLARNQKGFSLVEVMVAVVILAIGLMGLGTLLTLSVQYQTGYRSGTSQKGTWQPGSIENLTNRRISFSTQQSYDYLK